jgi:hypothetical protein
MKGVAPGCWETTVTWLAWALFGGSSPPLQAARKKQANKILWRRNLDMASPA